ncbi:MAG: thioredoxin family protein [Spirochaetia bacterium]|jgi:small redox-active disulfide protein 2|nr:thioredoxin family protein [Spirochaetia bacterium]
MKVQILGGGCPKCKLLEEHARQALTSLNMTAEIEKITSSDDIMEMGVMMTPALAIDGTVKSKGRVLSVEQIAEILKGEK